MNWILLILPLLTVFSGLASAASPIGSAERFIKKSGVPSTSLAFEIKDLSTGKEIVSHNIHVPLIPASILKAVTVSSLLKETGTGFRYHTLVSITGPVESGVLKGDVLVKGSGDPSLHSPAEPGSSDFLEEISQALIRHGIQRIEGRIKVDNTLWEGNGRPGSWATGDFSQSYGAPSYPFNFESNSSGSRSIERPDLVFINRLRSHLSKAGISVEGVEIAGNGMHPILDHVSAPIDEIMRSCMMRSDNLFAESMLRTFGFLAGTGGSHTASAAEELERLGLENTDTAGVVIVDGSGLSRSNRVTASFMTSLLENMASDQTYVSFFPLAGEEGTLKRFLAGTSLQGYAAMKTGSMNGIQCYAGYLLDGEYNPTHTVVVMMNGLGKGREMARNALQEMMLDMFGEIADGVDEGLDEFAD